MRERPKYSSNKSDSSASSSGDAINNGKRTPLGDNNKNVVVVAKRSPYAILALFVLVIYGAWGAYHYQFEILPVALTLDQVGKRGFSEHEAMKHIKALTQLGPHPVGSIALDHALQYVLEASKSIKKTAHWEVDVELDFFSAKSGANNLVGGLFKGKTLVYSDLNHIVLRILPKYASDAGENSILVSSHIDSVFAAEGAGDCSSCVAVMLELARGISQWAHGFKNAVIFLFNTGEEEGLNGAHSFITQHPWSDTIKMAIDLEAMGIGGKSSIFQAGPHPWAIEHYAAVAKFPTAQIIAEDIFSSGAIKSTTDFQVYKELAGLSGLDFAYMDNTAVYHTKNDKLELLKPGSLQHLGDNMLSFLLHAAASKLPEGKGESSEDRAIYFDILGTYLVTFRHRLAKMLYNSVIMQSLLLWTTSLWIGGYVAAISLALSCLGVILMWICSISVSVMVAFILPLVSSSPVPFVASPWLVVGLFGAPAFLGAFIGHHVGYLILQSYLCRTFVGRRKNLPSSVQAEVAKLDAERWLYKTGSLQWLILLMVGNFFNIGSSYLAFAWLAPPAFAYGILEATLSPARLPKPLKTLTLLVGLSVPILISSGMIMRLTAIVIGSIVRFVRNPGSTPEWLGNVIVAIFIAAIICLTMVYLMSYVHISGTKMPIIVATCFLFALSLGAVWTGAVPPFTQDTSRAVNVVHVVNATSGKPVSYISLFSTTPGNLNKEAEQIGEGFVCGRDRFQDFVTFSVNYSCWTNEGAETGWAVSDIPEIHVEKDTKEENGITQILIDAKRSTRWSLGINIEEIEDFLLKDAEVSEELIPVGEKSSVDGWHIIQFSGGTKSPTKFDLTLFWNKTRSAVMSHDEKKENLLLRIRTDVDRQTPQIKKVIEKLPHWCSLFGKSTSPHTLAFFTSLPVDF